MVAVLVETRVTSEGLAGTARSGGDYTIREWVGAPGVRYVPVDGELERSWRMFVGRRCAGGLFRCDGRLSERRRVGMPIGQLGPLAQCSTIFPLATFRYAPSLLPSRHPAAW